MMTTGNEHENRCAVCKRTKANKTGLCGSCAAALGSSLDEIALLLPTVDLLAHKLAKNDVSACQRRANMAVAPLPIDDYGYTLLDRARRLANRLMKALKQPVEHLSVDDCARFLLETALVAHQAYSGAYARENARETIALARRMRRYAMPNAKTVFTAMCPACSAVFQAEAHANTAICQHCGVETPVGELRAGSVGRLGAATPPMSAKTACRVLAASGLLKTTPSTLRTWVKRGKLTPVGSDAHGTRLYDVRDICAAAYKRARA